MPHQLRSARPPRVLVDPDVPLVPFDIEDDVSVPVVPLRDRLVPLPIVLEEPGEVIAGPVVVVDVGDGGATEFVDPVEPVPLDVVEPEPIDPEPMPVEPELVEPVEPEVDEPVEPVLPVLVEPVDPVLPELIEPVDPVPVVLLVELAEPLLPVPELLMPEPVEPVALLPPGVVAEPVEPVPVVPDVPDVPVPLVFVCATVTPAPNASERAAAMAAIECLEVLLMMVPVSS